MLTLGALVDPNLLLNIITLALALVAFVAVPRALTATRQKAELAAKDQTINTREQDNRALRDHQETLSTELAECKLAARRAESDAKTWQARYDEQSKYTAEPALQTINQLIASGNSEAERRHAEVMASLSNIGALVGDERRNSLPPMDDKHQP